MHVASTNVPFQAKISAREDRKDPLHVSRTLPFGHFYKGTFVGPRSMAARLA